MTVSAELEPFNGGDPDVDSLNQRAIFQISEFARKERENLLMLAHDAAVLFAKRDQIALGNATKGKAVDIYVLSDQIAGPEGETRQMLSLQFEREQNTASYEGVEEMAHDTDGLKLFVPIDTDAPLSEIDFGELPLPDVIYVERTQGDDEEGDGEGARYAISSSGINAYVSPSDDGVGVTEDEAFLERSELTQVDLDKRLEFVGELVGMAAIRRAKIDSGQPFVASLYQDFVNMRVVPQRSHVYGELDAE